MPWAKLDDAFFLNPKIGRASLEAIGVYMLSLTYAAHNLTDGMVPVTALHHVRCTKEIATELDSVGLWEDRGEDGFEIHDYLKYNPTRRKVLADRKKVRARVTKHRTDKKRERNAVTTASPVPVPVPGKESSNEDSHRTNGFKPDVYRLCQLLADLIAENGSKRPDHKQAKWLNDCRLMLERDGRPAEEAERLIRWCQQDDFWRQNILSMPKFRKQYDQLRLKAGIRKEAKRERIYTRPEHVSH